ncbi:MAG: hypothetical protein JSV89_13560 [Spirochaetaceae bacterium]|nr:MAG: hypothetical protein JSV89_13560 [Spirochaetaceae bacterium]
MRKLLLLTLLGLVAVGFVCSQDWDNPELLERLDLEEAEIEKIREIFEETEREIREARLEIDVLRAQLRKLLFQETVNMREVERLLRQSLDWELKERMAQIGRQVELRKILGDAKYARLTEAFQRRQRLQEEEERRLREEKERAEGGRR